VGVSQFGPARQLTRAGVSKLAKCDGFLLE